MVHCLIVPTVDFWLDWSIAATVASLRDLLPRLAAKAGYALREVHGITTDDGWARLDLFASGVEGSVGTLRAQDAGGGRSQLFAAPGTVRDQDALDHLNRAMLHLYVELIRRGLLAPPPPLEPPIAPLPDRE